MEVKKNLKKNFTEARKCNFISNQKGRNELFSMSSKANYQNYISREGGTKNRVTTEKQVTIFIGDRKQNLNS